MLISCAVTGQLICAFVLGYAKRRFSHDAAHMIIKKLCIKMFEKVLKTILTVKLRSCILELFSIQTRSAKKKDNMGSISK